MRSVVSALDFDGNTYYWDVADEIYISMHALDYLWFM